MPKSVFSFSKLSYQKTYALVDHQECSYESFTAKIARKKSAKLKIPISFKCALQKIEIYTLLALGTVLLLFVGKCDARKDSFSTIAIQKSFFIRFLVDSSRESLGNLIV